MPWRQCQQSWNSFSLWCPIFYIYYLHYSKHKQKYIHTAFYHMQYLFCIFLCISPKCPSGSPLVMVTGANGSGKAVTGCLACCRCFWFPLLAWSVPRWPCHRSLGYLWQTVPARCLDHDREGRLFVVFGEKRVLGWSCCCLGHC